MGSSISKTKVLSDQQIQRMVQLSVADAENIKMPESLTLQQTANFLTEKTKLVKQAREYEQNQLQNVATIADNLLPELRAAFFDKMMLTAFQESKLHYYGPAIYNSDLWTRFGEMLYKYYQTHLPARLKIIDDDYTLPTGNIVIRCIHPKTFAYAQNKLKGWEYEYCSGWYQHTWIRPKPVVDKTDHDRVAASLQPDIVPNAPPPSYA